MVSWWSKYPKSKPLDVVAEERHKKRIARMEDVLFVAACKLAGIKASKRQARKWNNGKGRAILFKQEARQSL